MCYCVLANIFPMMSLHSTIWTMQFCIQQKEQTMLKHYLSIDLTIQAMCDCYEGLFFIPSLSMSLKLFIKSSSQTLILLLNN